MQKILRLQKIYLEKIEYSLKFVILFDATLAQLVEQLICNQQVDGSSPPSGSIEKPL